MARTNLAVRITTLVLAGALNVVLIAFVIAWALTDGDPALGDGNVSRRVQQLLWFALLCGIGAFATIEILKRVLALRGYYQRSQTKQWLADRSGGRYAFGEMLAAMGLSEDQAPDGD